MLRTLTGSRRKFSFDLALHRSREKKYSGDRPSASATVHEEDEEDDDEVERPKTPMMSLPSGTPASTPRRRMNPPPSPGGPRAYLGPNAPPQTPSSTTTTTTRQRSSGTIQQDDGKGGDHGDESTRQSWLRLREARKRAQSPTAFRPRQDVARRGRLSARGDDAPRIRELSRDRYSSRTTTPRGRGNDDEVKEATPQRREIQMVRDAYDDDPDRPPPPEEATPLSKTPTTPKTPPTYGRSSEKKKKQPRKALVLQDPPSWQQLKAKALEADYAAMADFIENYQNNGRATVHAKSSRSGFFQDGSGSSSSSSSKTSSFSPPTWGSSSSARGDGKASSFAQRSASATRAPSAEKKKETDGPTFEKWFTARFPENQISSAPAAHKALWAEHERQSRFKRVEGRRKSHHSSSSSSERQTGSSSEPTSYLDRLRGGGNRTFNKRKDSEAFHENTDPSSHVPQVFKSGSVESPGRLLTDDTSTLPSTTLHVVTWKVERWSALPSGFRQGARYRPPGGNAWSLDLYKGGIKRERPGMIALYVHYDAPHDDAFATVTSLELSLMNQTSGAHLLRKHEGTRVFGPKADPARRISTSAGTVSPLSLCHVSPCYV